MPEAAHAELAGFLEQLRLLERRRGRRSLERVRRPGHQRQVCIADLTALDRLDTVRKLGEVVAHGDAAPHRRARHPAVVADPIDRAHRSLLFILLGLAEPGGRVCELQLEQILPMPNALQVGGELLRLAMRPGPLAKAVDGAEESFDLGRYRRDRVFSYHNFVSV